MPTLLKLSSARATARLGPEADALMDRVSAELDTVQAHARGLRGEARRVLLERLAAIDRELLDVVAAALPAAVRQAIDAEADETLSAYREHMSPEAFTRARGAAFDQLVRERANLPTIATT